MFEIIENIERLVEFQKHIVASVVDKITPNEGFDMDILSDNGPKVDHMNDLLPGDILLKRANIEPSTSMVIFAAELVDGRTSRYIGTSLLTHAAMYIGDGTVIEACSPKVVSTTFTNEDHKKYDWHVFRCNNTDHRNSAVNEAQRCIGVEYNYLGAGRLGLEGDGYNLVLPWMTRYIGIKAIDFTAMIRRYTETNKTTTKRNTPKEVQKNGKPNLGPNQEIRNGSTFIPAPSIPKELFCSELVVYCYDIATKKSNTHYFDKQPSQFSPEYLYIWLRDHESTFKYLGKLHAGVR